MNDSLKTRIVSHPFFQGMTPEYLDILAEQATEMKFEEGDTLFREGEPAAKFYLVETGRVLIEAHEAGDGSALIQTVIPGEVLGWSWLFPPFVWHFQARALEPVNAIVLDGARLLIIAENNHGFGFELLRRVA